ncbi:MAG: type II toxin-antitoxin system RnlA family toxin [Bacilli bacterium]
MAASKNPYKELNFPKEILESSIQDFCTANSLTFQKLSKSTANTEYYELIKPGVEKAQFQVFHLSNGKTTFHPKVGKNQELGTELAEYLLGKVTFATGQITSVLMGYRVEDIEPIIELMLDKKHPSGQSFFEFEKKEIEGGFRFNIQNSFYKDKLVVAIYHTGRLVIQGLPLSCHDEFIFQMAAVLNAEGLAKVISKTDENAVQLVEQRVIENTLSSIFKECYENIPRAIKNMLVSGSTLRSIKVSLPDYTCMLFPELRALEGMIKHIFFINDIEYIETVGELFDYISTHTYKLKSEVEDELSPQMAVALSKAYSFYHRHRHGLFHMQNDVNSSRTITSLETAMGLTEDIYKLIKDMYKSSP